MRFIILLSCISGSGIIAGAIEGIWRTRTSKI